MNQPLLPVTLDGVWLGLDALSAKEVLGPLAVVPVPGAPPHVPGVVPWNGRAIAVFDLPKLLGLEASAGQRQRTVVCQHGPALFALQVDAVREVVHVDDQAFRPVEAVHHAFALAECDYEGKTLSMLDLDGLLASVLPVNR
ncbi:MAG: chemotaxis protein CheW [Myxococcota bacterium]